MQTTDSRPTVEIQGKVTSLSSGVAWRWILLLMFAVAFAFFALCQGRRYGGDALKYMVWESEGPSIGPVNHALTPLWFWGWWKVVSHWAGAEFSDRIFWLATLNNLCGALSLVLLVDLIRVQARNRVAAILSGLLLAATAAFFFHSTQTTEPMMGVLWFVASWRLLVAENELKLWRVHLSALCFAISVLSYQSFILGGLGLLVLLLANRKNTVLWVTEALVAGVLLFVGAALAFGAEDARGVLNYIFAKPNGEYWGFFRLKGLLALPIGFANSIVRLFPENWPGLRLGFAQMPTSARVLFCAQVLVICSLACIILLKSLRLASKRYVLSALLIFVCSLFAPFYLAPYYNKLWLLPLVSFAVLVGNALVQTELRKQGLVAGLLLFLLFAYNFPTFYYFYHRSDNAQALILASLERSLRPNDLLVGDGWDHSVVYRAKYPGRPMFFLMFEEGDPEQLKKRISATQHQGGDVYFFNLLEKRREDWNLTDAQKRGKITYDALQPWREQAQLVWAGTNYGFAGNLYRLPRSK